MVDGALLLSPVSPNSSITTGLLARFAAGKEAIRCNHDRRHNTRRTLNVLINPLEAPVDSREVSTRVVL